MRPFSPSLKSIFVGLVLATATQAVQAQPLYGVNSVSNSNGLLYLNRTTGAIVDGRLITIPARTVTGALALTVDPTTGTAYTVAKVGGTTRILATIDLATGNGVEVGVLQVGGLDASFSTLAFRPNGQLFGVTGQNGPNPETLFMIDKTTAATTLASALGNGADGEVIAYNPNDDNFYHWSGNGVIEFETVLSVPPYTVTNISSTSGNGGEVFGAVWDQANNRFLVHHIDGNMRSWTTTGAVSLLGASGGGAVRGMTFAKILRISGAGTGTGTVTAPGINCTSTAAVTSGDCSETTGLSVSLTATPTPGFVFTGWSGDPDCTDGNVTMSADTNCIAAFFPAPVVNITGVPAPAAEGNPAGYTDFTFTLTRTGTALPFNVTYTITGDVVSGEDYVPVAGTISFTAAQTTRAITVSVKRDTKFEIHENLTLTLTGADSGAVLGATTVGTTTVLNDDAQPTVSIGNVTLVENNTTANFSVTLSNASYLQVTVTATTLNQTASDTAAPFAIADYVAASGPVTFNPGVISKTFPVTINQDTVYETAVNETFQVNLTSPVNATILVSQGIGSITDNDAKPTVSVSGGASSQAESVATYAFTVTLARPSVETISVIPVTVDGTASATAGVFPQADYLALPGSGVTFAPGETSKTVNVTVIDDAIDEAATETFSVQLTSLVNVDPGTLSRTGTINDNDLPPNLTLTAPAPVGEESGPAVFTISLSAISGLPVSVNAATAPTPGTATSGVDYTATGPQAFNWAPGNNTSQTFNVALLPDPLNEANETFRVNLTGNVNAGFTAGGNLANATIIDNDPIPSLSINDVSVTEGNAGTTPATFTVTLSAPSGRTVQVVIGTQFQTAFAPSDYGHVPGTLLTFPSGTTTQNLVVTVNGDVTIEPNETFLVNLSGPVNATIFDNQAVGTILNDESPALSINDVTLVEGNGPGTTNMNFTVSISLPAPPSGAGFTYVTSGLSATEGTDYVGQGPTTGAITAGNTTTTISIPINGDTTIEGAETFSVTLSNPTGTQVTILDGLGIGTIQNDDVSVPPGSLVISEFRLKGPAGSADEFIEIANPTSSAVTVYATNLSGGFSVADATGARVFTIPDGTTIPARGHFLAANNTPAVGYSLGNYGGVNAALPDATWTIDLADDVGLALFDTADPAFYGTATAYDAVGFTTDATPYREGTGLNGIGTGATANNHSFVRKHLFGGGSGLQDTNDNATDWVLVATDAGLYGATNAVLGGPSPENLAAENELSNTQLTISSGPGGTVAFLGPPKALEFRRTFTNNTGGTLNSIRFKVTSITGINNTVPGQADLRPTTSTTAAGFLGLTLESPPNYPLVTLPTPPGTLPIGGLGSTLRLNSGLPLLNGAAVNVNFRVEYTLSGASFYYWLVPEAK